MTSDDDVYFCISKSSTQYTPIQNIPFIYFKREFYINASSKYLNEIIKNKAVDFIKMTINNDKRSALLETKYFSKNKDMNDARYDWFNLTCNEQNDLICNEQNVCYLFGFTVHLFVNALRIVAFSKGRRR